MSFPSTENANGKFEAANTATGPIGRSIRRRSGRGGTSEPSGESSVASRCEPSSITSAKKRSWVDVRTTSPPSRGSDRCVSSRGDRDELVAVDVNGLGDRPEPPRALRAGGALDPGCRRVVHGGIDLGSGIRAVDDLAGHGVTPAHQNAFRPVSARPRMSWWISSVPSYVRTDSRLAACRITG